MLKSQLPPSAKNAPKVIGLALFILGLAGAAVYLADRAENERVSHAPMETVKRSPSVAVPSEPAPSTDAKCNTVGQICIVKGISGVDFPVLAATSLQAYTEMTKLVNANDKDGLIQMARAQDLIGPKPGDRVRVLDHSVWNERIEARITTGEHQGRKVWMSTAWVKGQ